MKKESTKTERIPLDRILPNPEQPRKDFDPLALESLAASIREHDVLVPIVVEACQGGYILQDGERRLRAAKMAGLSDIPAVIHPPLEGDAPQARLVRALVVNVQRSDLNPIEEGQAYRRMQETFGWSVNEIGRQTGLDRVRIDNLILLTRLEPEIRTLIAAGKYYKDPTLARAILKLPDRDAAVRLVRRQSRKGATLKACLLGVKRLAETLMQDDPLTGDVPSLAVARRKAGLADDNEEPPRWQAMRELGVVPPWGMLAKTALDTCSECELRSMASHAVCGRCQLVDMLRRLMESAQ
jgi:ParB/RepB/Spo0J family partition protein